MSRDRFISLVNQDKVGSVADACGFAATSKEKVVELNLQGNQINSLTGLSDFVNVKKVNLSSNDIESLVASDLGGLDALEVLDLASNSLLTIAAGGFPPLSSLRRLNLSYNLISSIEGISVLSELEYLDLRENKIANVEDLQPLYHCTKLQVLVLQTAKGEQQNSVCQGGSRYFRETLTMLTQVRVLDHRDRDVLLALPVEIENDEAHDQIENDEVQDQIENDEVQDQQEEQDLEMPHFSKAAERFLARKNSPKGNPWEENESRPRWSLRPERAPSAQRTIVHTRIVKQSVFSMVQRQQLRNIADDMGPTDIRSPEEVIEELGFDKKENVILDPVSFRFMLEMSGVNMSLKQIETIFDPSEGFSALTLDHFAELLGILKVHIKKKKVMVKNGKKESKPSTKRDVGTEASSDVVEQSIQTEAEVAIEERENVAPSNQGQDEHSFLLVQEVKALRERLETNTQELVNSRISTLEEQLRSVQHSKSQLDQETLKAYEAKLAKSQSLKDEFYTETVESLRLEIKVLEDKLSATSALVESEREQGFQCSQDLARVSEQLKHEQKNNIALEEKFHRLQEAAQMTQGQLTEQVANLAEKLARSEAKNDSYMIEAQDRGKEAAALNERLGLVLAESQHSQQNVQHTRDKVQSLEREKHELKQRLENVQAQNSSSLENLRQTVQNLHDKLVEEKEQVKRVRLREQQLRIESDQMASFIREQKAKLERVVVALREKDVLLEKKDKMNNELSKKLQEANTRFNSEIESQKLELETLKRRVRSVDDERALSLRSQAEADAAREETERVKLIFQGEKKKLQEQLSDLNSSLQVKETMLRDQNDSIRKLEIANSEREDAVREMELLLERSESRVGDLEARLRDAELVLEEKEEATKVVASELKKQLDRKTAALEMVESEVEKFRELFRDQGNKLKENEAKLSKMESMEATVEQVKKESLQKMEALTKEHEGIVLELREGKTKVAEELRVCQEERRTLDRQMFEKSQVLEKQEALIAELRVQSATSQNEIKVLAQALEHERRKGQRNVKKFESLIEEMR